MALTARRISENGKVDCKRARCYFEVLSIPISLIYSNISPYASIVSQRKQFRREALSVLCRKIVKNMSCHEQWMPVLMMVAVNFGFATVNVFLKKIIDKGLNHLVIVAYRQSISVVFLAPIVYFRERKNRPKLTIHILCQLFFSALIGLTLTQYFLLRGLEYTSATFFCAFLNTVPVITFLLALPFGLEKVNMNRLAGKTKVLGTVVCVGGVVLLTLYKGKLISNPHLPATNYNVTSHAKMMISSKKTERWIIGSIFLIAGCTTWSSWFLMQARIGKRFPCQYSSTTIISFFSAIQSAILSLIIERNLPGWVLKGKLETIGVIYCGMVGSGLCYVGMSWCVKKRGPVFTSAFSPLTQIVVAIFDFSVLRERIYLGSALGSILVIVGMYILLWGKSKETEEFDQMKQGQAAQQDERCDAASHVIPITSNPTSS